jgi:formylglycine-generating enzyme required for sulfatase activity
VPVKRIEQPVTVALAGGWFAMGSEDGRDNERPVHHVWTDPFSIAVFPVTNSDYGRFVEASGRPQPPMWRAEGFDHPDQPVVCVSWYDAMAYCRWLSEASGRSYRLPTEAERERAARGGAERLRYPWGDALPDWMDPEGKGAAVERPDRVGQDPPNGYGLHNMGDLVHEWCSDWYDADYYRSSPERNPRGPANGTRKSSRGGAWRHRIKVARCAARSSIAPDFRYDDYGFRVARSESPAVGARCD